MQDIEALVERFADTPRSIVLKADVMRRGLAVTEELQRAGKQACVSGPSTKLVGLLDPALAQLPCQLHFLRDETTVDLVPDPLSPYGITESDGQWFLSCESTPLEPVRFTPRPAYFDSCVADGTPVGDLVMQRGPHCFIVSANDRCAYHRKGDACRYCVWSPAMALAAQAGITRPVPDFELTAEAVAIAAEEVELRDLKLTGGGMYNIKQEGRRYGDLLEAIGARTRPPEEVTIFSQALEPDAMKRLKELGATNAQFNMEVWEAELWDKTVPGKSKAIGRAQWLERLSQAVEIFGYGHVGTSFVAGFECAAGAGYLAPQEALASYRAGFAELLDRGVIPSFTIWTAQPFLNGFERDAAPPTDFYLQLAQETHELLEKRNIYSALGFDRGLGVDPPTLGLYCFYCFSMSFMRDYPRLIGRREQRGAGATAETLNAPGA